MKLGIITSAMICMVGCSSASETIQHVKDVTTVEVYAPKEAHLVWCRGEASGCFDSASLFCGEGGTAQHPKPGKFHQVAESDMAFPAMIQSGDGWRMLIVCDKENGGS